MDFLMDMAWFIHGPNRPLYVWTSDRATLKLKSIEFLGKIKKYKLFNFNLEKKLILFRTFQWIWKNSGNDSKIIKIMMSKISIEINAEEYRLISIWVWHILISINKCSHFTLFYCITNTNHFFIFVFSILKTIFFSIALRKWFWFKLTKQFLFIILSFKNVSKSHFSNGWIKESHFRILMGVSYCLDSVSFFIIQTFVSSFFLFLSQTFLFRNNSFYFHFIKFNK